MNVELTEAKILPNAFRVATVLVKYHELQMKCDLVYSPKFKKAWVRMPELWKENKKQSVCFWPSRDISDAFQVEIIKQVFRKLDLNIDKIEELYKTTRRRNKKKVDKI